MKRTHIILVGLTFLFVSHIQATGENIQHAQKDEQVSISTGSDWKQSALELMAGFGSGVAGVCVKHAISSVFSHMASIDGSFPTLLGSMVVPWALTATAGSVIFEKFPILSQKHVKYAAMFGVFCTPLLSTFVPDNLLNML